MTRFKFLPAIFLVAIFFTSCTGDDKKTTDTTVTTDTATAAVTTPETPAKPGLMLITKGKMANFGKWKAYFDTRDSVRQANGMRTFIVARGLKDSNTLMVVYRIDDPEKVKAYRASPEFKALRKAAGMIGDPTEQYLDVQWMDSSPGAGDTRVIGTHKVKDWEAWKKSFDSHKQVRVDAGLSDRAVGYAIGDPTMVTVAFVINDMAKAEAFMKSEDLKNKMAEAGVVGQPEFFFYKVVQSY